MKRLLLITGVLLITYVVMMSALSPSARSYEEIPASAAVTQMDEGDVYTVLDENGRVAVLLNGIEYLRTDTVVSSLPKADQTKLKQGITVTDKAALKKLLEDYCS
ncbi:MAG: hypothetical protein IJH32_00920 [Ruminococcus sp.]|nr:hypothetical protein [Ruminococcus sp.]